MKFKIVGVTILSATLLLSACSKHEVNVHKDDDKKSESKSDKTSNNSKKDKKSDDKKKNENKEKQQANENNVQQNEQQTQQNNTQDNQQARQQPTQTQQAQTQQNNSALTQEQMQANAKVAKRNGFTGIPNGDMGGVPTSNKAYSNDQLDPETGLPKDDAVPQDAE